MLRLVSGYARRIEAVSAAGSSFVVQAGADGPRGWLVERLSRFSAAWLLTMFLCGWIISRLSKRDVVKHCRAIPYGQTSSYGQLAEAAGSPGRRAAVGNTMAMQSLPIIVPCHRVDQLRWRIGHYIGTME